MTEIMNDFKEFNASTVPLAGSNLIEASAGTGKTYSIAILTLRLVLENKLSIKEILMVTFTKAAVAELEERIRLFIRQAYKASTGESITDSTIRDLVQGAIDDTGTAEVEALLKEAVLFLDETSVLTIHSFCQQSLNEFAFETGQLFGSDLLQSTSALLEEEINAFWRENVTGIPTDVLNHLLAEEFSRGSLTQVVQAHLGGKRYFVYDSGTEYSMNEEHYSPISASLDAIQEKEEKACQALEEEVIQNAGDLKNLIESNGYARKTNLADLVDDPPKFLKEIWKKKTTGYIIKLFPELLDQIETYTEYQDQRSDIIQEAIRKLNCWSITEATKGIAKQKQFANQLSFDDLIFNLHTALVKRKNPALVSCLQQKYKAVFIDEFQDTDSKQYEIFETAFGTNTILFYIGDPKQSIYAWRQADIFTYFKAKQQVQNVYGMNQNYRSSAPLIEAMNQFFKPEPDFDTFHFQGAESAIDYVKVDSPKPNTKGNLWHGDALDVPISISQHPNNDRILQAVAGEVVALLSSEQYFIQEKESKRPVQPADIGILVRTNKQGQAVKTQLAKYGIPAVTIGDAKVLQTPEARYLYYLLEAIVDISIASINKALLSPFTGFDDRKILALDEEHSIELFRNYKVVWEKDGIYAALNTFIHDFNVKQNLLASHTESGERVLTNTYQLIELLHKMQSTKMLSPLELIAWLKRGREGDEQEGDEFEQRIESDEGAVNIVTIHKSKGLEYNLVLAPHLDLVISTKYSTCSYRDSETGDYIFVEKDLLDEDQFREYEDQLEQENRRLIYVAITRAVYKCSIFRSTAAYYKSSSLVPFIDALAGQENNLIQFNEAVEVPDGYRYPILAQSKRPIQMEPVHFRLIQPYWRKMSYTMLSADHEFTLKNQSHVHEDLYDRFIFSQLTKGAKTGNMLHYILENVAFNQEGRWEYAINSAVQQYAPNQAELYTPMLRLMLAQVFGASIPVGEDRFQLSDVQTEHIIHELEFDFTVSPFQVSQLAKLSDENMEVRVKDYYEIEGVMNGKIDLFFEHQGKYYVLDWKSNFLGDSLSDYLPDSLVAAMNENNYHLQHLIYSLATKRYLESRLPNFDYETQFGGVIYLFLRGVRADAETGVFTYRPSLEKIAELDGLLAEKEERVN